jgi:hypothetical protein
MSINDVPYNSILYVLYIKKGGCYSSGTLRDTFLDSPRQGRHWKDLAPPTPSAWPADGGIGRGFPCKILIPSGYLT